MRFQFNSNNTRAIWIGGFATLLASFQLVIFNSYVVIFLQEDLLTEIAIITLIVSLRNFLQMFFRIPLGELSQIIGRKPLILTGHFCYTFALGFLVFASDWTFVLIATILVAFGMSAFWPSIFGYIADFTPNNFGKSNGRIFQLSDAGVIIGSLLSKYILDSLHWELKELFFIIVILGIFSGIVSFILLPEGLNHQKRKITENVFRELFQSFFFSFKRLSSITRLNELHEVYIFQIVLAFTEFMVTTFLPLIIISRGYTRGSVAEIAFWATLIIIWFKPSLGNLTDKLKFSSIITISLIIISLCVLSFIFIVDFWLIILLYVILNAAIITGYTAENGEVARRGPDHLRGATLGALGFYVSFGRTLSTVSLGPIWDNYGLISVFQVTGVLILVITFFLFLIYRSKDLENIKTLNQDTIEM